MTTHKETHKFQSRQVRICPKWSPPGKNFRPHSRPPSLPLSNRWHDFHHELSPDIAHEWAQIEFNALASRGFGLAAFHAIVIWKKMRW